MSTPEQRHQTRQLRLANHVRQLRRQMETRRRPAVRSSVYGYLLTLVKSISLLMAR